MGTNLQRKNLRCCWSLSPLLIVPILRSFEEHSNKLMLFVILIIMVMEVFCAYRPTAHFKAFHNIPWGIQFDTSVLVSIPLFQHPCLPPLSQKQQPNRLQLCASSIKKVPNFGKSPYRFSRRGFRCKATFWILDDHSETTWTQQRKIWRKTSNEKFCKQNLGLHLIFLFKTDWISLNKYISYYI